MGLVRKSFHENTTIEVTRKGCVGKESSRRREVSAGEVSHLKTEPGSPGQKGKGPEGKARLAGRAAS